MISTNKKNLIISMIITAAFVLITCATLSEKKAHSFGDDCKHCHGERLQGIHNTRAYCGQCHDLKPLAAADVQDEARKETLLSEPHIHTTKNVFNSTPSCFNCHRRTDF